MKTLQELIDDGQSGNFDFAFIDASKTEYPIYYKLCLQLLRTGGVIAVDNVSASKLFCSVKKRQAKDVLYVTMYTFRHFG